MMLAAGQVVAARYELARPLAAGHDPATWLSRDREREGREVVLRFYGARDGAGVELSSLVRHPALLAPVAHQTADDCATGASSAG